MLIASLAMLATLLFPTHQPQEASKPPSTQQYAFIALPGIAASTTLDGLGVPVIGKSHAAEEAERLEAARLEEAKAKQAEEERRKKIGEDMEAARERASVSVSKAPRIASRPIGATTGPGHGSVRIIGTSAEQCVAYFKRMTGITRPLGYAGSIPAQGGEPRIGAGALSAKYGHVSLVVAINGDMLTLHDANFQKNSITERVVNRSSQRGYIYN